MKNKELISLHSQPYRTTKPLKLTPISKFNSRRKKRMTELPSVSEEYIKPKVVLFYKNGDRNFRGSHVTVTPRRFRNFDNLLNELTRITNLSQGARYIFTPDTGSRIDSLEALDDGKAYVCGSYPKLKKINYSHAPDGSKPHKKKPNRNFIPVHTASKLNVDNCYDRPPANLKPKIVNIIRNSVSINRKVTKILLNKRTAQSYEQVLNDITATVGVVGGFVRKLYNKHGKIVVNLSELFGEEDVFIAVGSEKFRPTDIPAMIEDSGLGKATTTKSNPSLRTMKTISPIPSPPKTCPPKKKKVVKSNIKPMTLTYLKTLPSIEKRKEPEGEAVKPESNLESDRHISSPQPSPHHVELTDQDMNSEIDDNKIITNGSASNKNDEKSDEDILSDFINKKSISRTSSDSSVKSRKSSKDSTVSEKNGSSRSSSPEISIKNDNEPTTHIDLDPENTLSEAEKSEISSSPEETPRKHSTCSAKGSKNTTKSENLLREKSSASESAKSNVVLTDSNTEKEEDKENSVTLTTPNEEIAREVTSASSKSDMSVEHKEDDTDDKNQTNALDSSEVKNDTKVENLNLQDEEEKDKEVYTETLSKVFDDHSEIEQYYDIGKKLGDGNFAVVNEAIDKRNNIAFAMKIIDAAKIEGKLAMLNNEIKIQRGCSHPNIVQLYHDMHSPTKIFLIMELISGGDFFDLIANNVSFEEEEASIYMRDLCSGLDYLHQRDIVHRDIKPENLMVYENNGQIMLKIADFGLAMKVTSPIFTICGTPTYVAPEILTEDGYGLEVDIWAAGVILYIMLCGFPPFRSLNRKQTELFDMIEKGEFEFLEPYWEDVSEAAKDLISNVLVVDRKNRLTAKKTFSHKWLLQFNLNRNNTILNISPRKSNRFKTTAKGIQSIQRMKLLLGAKLERENFITHVHDHDSETRGSVSDNNSVTDASES